MNIKFIIEKEERKALAQKIGELTGSEVKYLGVPSCGYQIGAYTLDKEAVLHGDELPDDIRSELQKAGYTAEDEPVALTISMPRDFFTEQSMNNLLQLMSNIEWGTETDKKLEQIAMDADFALEQRGGLDTRRNDTEDFIELSVWGIREMLRKAYELGKAER